MSELYIEKVKNLGVTEIESLKIKPVDGKSADVIQKIHAHCIIKNFLGIHLEPEVPGFSKSSEVMSALAPVLLVDEPKATVEVTDSGVLNGLTFNLKGIYAYLIHPEDLHSATLEIGSINSPNCKEFSDFAEVVDAYDKTGIVIDPIRLALARPGSHAEVIGEMSPFGDSYGLALRRYESVPLHL